MYVWLAHLASEHKFVCLMHSEAKLTETLEFGAGKALLQGHGRRRVAHAPKTLYSVKGFSKVFLKAR